MELPRFTVLIRSLAGTTLLALPMPIAFAQGVSAPTVLGRLAAAFSGSQVVQQIQLTGNAVWHVGNSEDSGTVTLTAATNGTSQMQLNLVSTGGRTESQTGSGLSARCQWAGADGVAHAIRSGAYWRPVLWFLPALSLQPSLLSSSLGVSDLGIGTVGARDTPLRHLQSQLMTGGVSHAPRADVTQWGKTDIG